MNEEIKQELMKRVDAFNVTSTLKATVENSPWHREDNVWVHTHMTIDWYMENLAEYRTPRQQMLTVLALLFHDMGKPEARQEKFSEARGKYSSFGGHEIISARHFEAFMVDNRDMLQMMNLTWLDILAVTFVIENHLPYDLKLEKQRNLRTATNAYLGEDEIVFTDVLLSDTHGRISDDQEEKRRKVFAWTFGFKELTPDPERKSADTHQTLIVMIGASGSGKSTWTKLYREQRPGEHVVVFSLDDARIKFFNQMRPTFKGDDIAYYREAFKFANDNTVKFNNFADSLFQEALKNADTVIVDNVNASRKSRRKWLTTADQKGFKTWAVMFPMSKTLLAERSDKRTDKKVPQDAVDRQFMGVSVPWAGSEVNSITVVAPS